MFESTPALLVDLHVAVATAAILVAVMAWLHAARISRKARDGTPARIETLLRQIDDAVAPETGAGFFAALVTNLARTLDIEYGFVAVVDAAQPGRIATLAAWSRGMLVENLVYQIEGTPCEHALRHGPCVYPANVRQQFPEAYLLQHLGIESYVGTPLLDSGGSAVGVLGVMDRAALSKPQMAVAMLRIFARRAAAEIERVRAQDALRSSEEKLSKVFSSSPDAITLSSLAEGRYLDVNEGFTRIFGYEREEVIGRAALDVGLWRTPADREQLVASLGAGGAVRNLEAELVSREGAVKTCLVSADIIEIDGRACMLAVTRDISDRKAAEVAQHASERRYRALFEESQALNLVVDRDATLVDVNDVVARTFEVDRAALIGRSALDFLDANDQARVKTAIETLFNGGRVVPCHIQVLTEDTRRTLMLAFGGVDDSGARPTVLVNALDVTEWHRARRERNRLEEQVRQSQKMEAIGRLAGGIAHDFNNILQLTHGHLTLALEHVPAGSPPASAVSAALKVVARATALTRQLLTFSRRDPGQTGSLDLAAEVADLATLMQGVIGEHITLEVTTEEHLPAVRMDRTQLEQIVLNLCINARDAMPTGGRIAIDTRRLDVSLEFCSTHPGSREGAFVCLSVSDSGAGIPPELQTRIFEPFFTTKEIGRGTGLGLATVYGIVQRFNGFLDVVSEVGVGTSMRVFLPIAEEPAQLEVLSSVINRGEVGTPTILVAEADRAVRDLACISLERAGYRVLRASNPEQAQALFNANKERIALAVIDASISTAEGNAVFQFLSWLRPDLPILFSTGYGDHALTDGDASNRYPVIRKPYVPSELVERVRDLLDGPRDSGQAGETGLLDDPRR